MAKDIYGFHNVPDVCDRCNDSFQSDELKLCLFCDKSWICDWCGEYCSSCLFKEACDEKMNKKDNGKRHVIDMGRNCVIL